MCRYECPDLYGATIAFQSDQHCSILQHIAADCSTIAAAGVEGEDVSLTPLMVFFIARGYTAWLAKSKGVDASELRIAIGADSRLSGLTMRCDSPILIASQRKPA